MKKISLKNKSLSDIFFDVYLLASRIRLPILVGLKQETVSLMCRKCAGSVARWLHLSEEEDGRNSVSCITPYGMVHETLFLCPDDTERMWKQRQAEYLFCLQKCTNCSSLRNFYILLFRHLLFVGVLWFPFLKLHFPNYSLWYQLSWFLSKYHYYSFFIGTWNYE